MTYTRTKIGNKSVSDRGLKITKPYFYRISTYTVTDHVPRAADRVQQRPLETLVDLRAQPRNVHVDHVGLRIEMIVPDVLQQHGTRHHLTGMLHQIFEQAEFARLECQFVLAAGDAMGEPVELEIADPVERVFGRTAAPARQHLDTGQQLGEGIGFWQIVVAAGTQALDAVVDLPER